MKYRITITKIEEKPVIKSVYISDAELERRQDLGVNRDNYRDTEVTERVSEIFYEQTRESNIDLMGVIAAFNKDSA